MSRTAVFLHGVPTSAELWAPLVRILGGWAPDLPGHGKNAASAGGSADVGSFLEWLDEERKAGGLGPWESLDLVGHDYGGLLAAAAAAQWGARSLVLTSTALGPGWWPARIGAAPGLHHVFYRHHGGRLWLRHAVDPVHRASWLRTFDPGLERPGVADQMRRIALGIGGPSIRALPARLAAARVPVLCLWGSDDRYYPPSLARRTAAAVGARLVLVRGARHAAVWEQPRTCALAIEEFWRETVG